MKHWAFDLDGTLVDSFSHYFRSLEDLFRSRGKTFSGDLFHSALTHPLEQFFEEHLGRDAVANALADLQLVANTDAEAIRPFEGIPAVLAGLRARGARIAIWTNRDLDSAQRILRASGLDRYAELCMSGTCVERKPSPEGLTRILEHFGCEASDLTMVGDHEHDVTTPKGAGARAVRASWHAYFEIDPCAYADAQFYSVADFAKWVGR